VFWGLLDKALLCFRLFLILILVPDWPNYEMAIRLGLLLSLSLGR